ncbi:MAG: aspartate kinase [Victivallales bacterium]|nr:aspartate kinase [Victivallales bacterium]
MHTVEKIGGTSMSRFEEVMRNVIIGKRKGDELYNRIFVVSAYGGITNLLLEDKKTGHPGVYGKFAANDPSWEQALEAVRQRMLEYNRSFASSGLDQEVADNFVNTRIDGVAECLHDLMRLRGFGHFDHRNYLPQTRELLSAVGEAHSAYNAVLILQRNGINARFVDLTGWMDADIPKFDEAIIKAFSGIDLSRELPIVTGYVKYDEGIMTRFDRGYSEITFSKIAVLTHAREGIIHKEYHLCTGDPKLIGTDKVEIIGNTNFDIADQLSDLDMEAIHSKASKDMEQCGIPIRIKNAFDPENPGTLISCSYTSPLPRVEMICGRNDIMAIEVMDPEMVSKPGYDYNLLKSLADFHISYITKTTNANTITHFVPGKKLPIEKCVDDIKRRLPGAQVTTAALAMVSVIGTNMKIPGFLSKASTALYEAGINTLAMVQSPRQINMQFIIDRKDFQKAQCVLHKAFVEDGK